MPELRPVALDDIAELVAESEHEFLRSRDESDLTMWDLLAAWRAARRVWAFVSVEGDTLTGYITAMAESAGEGELILGPMYVSPASRGQGIGVFQIRALVAWAVGEGFRSIRTRTWGRNTPSRRSLESAGFAAVSRTPDHRVDGDSTIWYQWSAPGEHPV